MIKLRQFNEEGLRVFERFIDSCSTNAPKPYPDNALFDTLYSEPVGIDIAIERRKFGTRLELAEHLYKLFESANFHPSLSETKIWAWLACFFFQEICPKKKGGSWNPGNISRWVPRSNDFRTYYRHLIAGPYFIYRAHNDDPSRAMAVLCQLPGRPGDLVEQLASRQQIITNPAIMQIATDWFVDPSTGKQNRYANSKRTGGARRFISVLAQYDVTWDLSIMSADELRELLPSEFRR